MSQEHASIADAQRHEPKGASTAASNTGYFSDGAASGTWKKVGVEVLKGLTGDGGLSGQKFISDGSNGFLSRRDAAYGAMVINNNGSNFALTAAGDGTLNTNGDYVLLTGGGAPWASENLFGVTFSTNSLSAPVTGLYRLDIWAKVKSFPTTAAEVAFKYRNSVSAVYSTRRASCKSTAAGDEDSINMSELVQLTAADTLQIYAASTTTGNLVLRDVSVSLQLIRQTA